jgi:gas vesicle structural protein
MAVAVPRNSRVQRNSGGGSSLVDILDRVLDKGIVIDAWVRVSLVGIELLTIEARVVVASVDTYLKYAEAIGATDLVSRPQSVVEMEPAVQTAPPPEPPPIRPSEEEVLRFLAEHSDGLPISEMENHFGIPRSRIEDIVNHLLDEHRVRKDEERGLLMPT